LQETEKELKSLSNNEANALKSSIESISSLQIKLFDKEDLKTAALKAEFSKITESISEHKDLVNQSKAYLNHGNFHPIKEDILDAYDKLDYHIYDELLIKLNKLTYAQKFADSRF